MKIADILYYNLFINKKERSDFMKGIDLPEVKLSYKQKLILDVLTDEFHGQAFGPQLLDESDNENIKNLTINEITWAFKVLVESALVEKEKKLYKGRTLNLYSISDYIKYNAVKIK